VEVCFCMNLRQTKEFYVISVLEDAESLGMRSIRRGTIACVASVPAPSSRRRTPTPISGHGWSKYASFIRVYEKPVFSRPIPKNA